MRLFGFALSFGGPQMAGPTAADLYAAIDRLRQLPPALQAGLAEAIAATRDMVDKVDLFLDRIAPPAGLSAEDEAALAAATRSLQTARLALADAVAATGPQPPTAEGQ